jgi:hypothetical protein
MQRSTAARRQPPLRVLPFHDIEVPEVTDRRHTSGELPSLRLDHPGVDFFPQVLRKCSASRSNAITPLSPTRWT